MDSSDFSIVVPSLLNVSVKHIDNHAYYLDIPAFVCIPFSFQGPFQDTPNIIYIRSSSPGQVSQRLFAVHTAKTSYVIAMDDDIHIASIDLFAIIKKYYHLLSSYAAPVLGVQIKSRNKLFNSDRKLSLFSQSLLAYIENTTVTHLRKPSTISPLCFNSHHDSSYCDSFTPTYGCYCSEWISGGLFIAPRSLFPSNSYYPFSGKAFAEDVILSCIFKRYGASMFIANSVIAFTDSIFPSYTLSNLRAKFYLLRFSPARFRVLRMIFSLIIRQLSLQGIL